MQNHLARYLLILISVLLACAVFGSFYRWWITLPGKLSVEFTVFVWSLVVSVIFLLITRAYREGKGY